MGERSATHHQRGPGDVLRLGVAERPYLIPLDALGFYAAHGLIVESFASLARLGQQLRTVLIDTSTTREIDRMEEPSQSMARIWMRLASGNLSMPLL